MLSALDRSSDNKLIMVTSREFVPGGMMKLWGGLDVASTKSCTT